MRLESSCASGRWRSYDAASSLSSAVFRLKAEATMPLESASACGRSRKLRSSEILGVFRLKAEATMRLESPCGTKPRPARRQGCYARTARTRRRGRWDADTDLTMVRPPPVFGSGTSDCAMAARISARTAGVFNVAALGSRTKRF